MGIQDFKRWHWIIIGAAVGAILAFARLQTEPGEAGTTGAGEIPGEADVPPGESTQAPVMRM